MKKLSELKEVNIVLATERLKPEIRLLVLERYLGEVRNEIVSLSEETEIKDFISIETHPAEIKGNPGEWLEFLLTIDWITMISVIGLVSSMINIGTFVYKTFDFLRRRRARKEVKKLKMNCTTSVALAINHLRSIGAQMRQNETKLVYLSGTLAYYCVAIFASPISNPEELHVITTHIDSGVSGYTLIAL